MLSNVFRFAFVDEVEKKKLKIKNARLIKDPILNLKKKKKLKIKNAWLIKEIPILIIKKKKKLKIKNTRLI